MNAPTPPRVLVVDDDDAVREALESTLSDAGYVVTTAAGVADTRAAMKAGGIDLVLLDVRLRDGDGLALLGELRGLAPEVPVIMATAYGDSERTIRAMKTGAFDYVTKPFDLPALLATVARAARAPAPAKVPAMASDGDFIGSSPAMLGVWKAIGRAAASAVPVLITGESGVGKELAARAVHQHGDRRARPFVAVNVAALPASIVESELFGHEKGAFTGATARRIGRFEAAGDGALFLDEIGDLEPPMQTKLLRVLEDGSFERVGGAARLTSSARIIAATSRPVKPGPGATLREDLYYRLSVVSIHIPPLRERTSDIPLLVDAFLKRRGGPRRAVSEAALEQLVEFDWPGNVRQLLHVVESACVMSVAEVLDIDDFALPRAGAASAPEIAPSIDGEAGAPEEDLDLRANLERVERALIARALQKAGGNRALAARLLGIRRQHLYTRLVALGLGDAER